MSDDSRKLIFIVGDGTLPQALQAVLQWVFQEHNPVVLCTTPEQYPSLRDGGDPDLVIVTDQAFLQTVVRPDAAERYLVIYDDTRDVQADSVNGISFVRQSCVFQTVTEPIGRLLWP